MGELSEGTSGGFRDMIDEEIVSIAKDGSKAATEHLLSKYRFLVEGKARTYFLAGADHEDVIQEGMIGLFKAIRDYRADKLAHFRAFAELCVTRQIITAVKTASRQKHLPLNSYLSLHGTAADVDGESSLLDVLPDKCVADPEKIVLDSHIRDYLDGKADANLSPLESEAVRCYMLGMSYREMAAKLRCGTKSVDNALQRAKRKIGIKVARD